MTDISTIADAVDALTQPVRHTERIYERRKLIRVWTVTLPSLLEQLHHAVVPGEVYAEDQNGAKLVPRSIPPAQLEAINAIIGIEAGSALWVRRAHLTLRRDATANLRALCGATWTSDQATDLLADLRRWYGWAATLTGWINPPWTPQAPCPLCEARQLRVRLERKTATCLGCGESWTEDTIGLLAEHVKTFSEWSAAEAKAARLRAAQTRQRERGAA